MGDSPGMQKRLDMLLNISVAGLKDVDKASQTIRKHGSDAKATALGLTEMEGASENAAKNFKAFQTAAGKASTTMKRYNDIQTAIAGQQEELSKLTKARSEVMAAAEEKSAEAVGKLESAFENLKSSYIKAEQAAGKTFKPLEQNATDAKVSMAQLKTSLAEIEASIRGKTQASEQYRNELGQYTKEPVDRTTRQDPVDLSKLEQEQQALSQRADVLRETIAKVDELTKAQERHNEAQRKVSEASKGDADNLERIRAVEAEVERLTQSKKELIATMGKESNTSKLYAEVQKQIKDQEKEIAEMTNARAQALANAEAKSSQATNNLEESFKRLKTAYAEAEQAAGKTFKPIEGDAKNASVGLEQLKGSLAKIGQSYYELDQIAKKFRDSAGKPIKQPKGVDSSINIKDVEQEMKALDQKAQVIRDTMTRVEQLTEAQREYARVRKEVNEIDKKQKDNARFIEESQEEVNKLIQRKEALLQKLEEEKQANQAYKRVHKDLQKQQQLLTKLSKERARSVSSSEKEAEQAAQKVKTVFEELKALYAKAGQAAGETFEPLGEGASNAQTNLERLKAALAEVEKSQQQIAQTAQTAQAAFDFSGQKGAEAAPGQVNLEELEQEKAALAARADIIRDTIERAEQLTKAQQDYAKVQKEVADIEKKLNANTAQTEASQKAVEQLTNKKHVLVKLMEKYGQVLNDLSGQSLVAVNKTTGEATIRQKELDGVLRAVRDTTAKTNAEMEKKAKVTERAANATERKARSTRQTTSALQQQNEEWTVMRQRISKNNEALWGLRRSLGALRNQILVVLFATRFLRNAMASARDTIIEVDQGMIGLRRTAISMGEDFKHLERITREFEKRGLQNADEAAVALRNILQTGLGVEEATSLLYVFTDAAAFNARSQRDLTDSVIRASEAFRDQRAQGLQAIGINQRMTDMVRAHANAVGKQTAEITGAERSMAIYTAIMAESGKFVGNANDLLHTFEGRLISMSGAAKSSSEAFGNLLRPVFMEFTNTMIDAHKASQKFFEGLREEHREDIDKWASRVAKFIQEVTGALGAAGGGLLKLIIKYGDWLVILGQVMIAKSIINKRLAKHAAAMQATQKEIAGYNFRMMESNSILATTTKTMVVKNNATKQEITGLQALNVLYKKHRIDVVKQKAALRTETGARALNIKLLRAHKQALIAQGMSVDQATASVKANKAAILANTGALTLKKRALLTLIPSLVAARGAVIAFGGALKAVAAAAGALLLMMGKFALIFLAIGALTRLIGHLTGARERADELALANNRLNRSFEQLATGIDRANRRFRAVQERADIFGVDIHQLDQVRSRVQGHYDTLLELQEQHNNASNAKEQERIRGYIDIQTELLNEQRDHLEMLSQQKMETFSHYDNLILETQEKNLEAITDLMSHYGTQQIYEARRNQQQFLQWLEDHHVAIEKITSVSALARMRFEKWVNNVELENARKAKEEEKALREDIGREIINNERRVNLDRLQLERESVDNIRQQYAIRKLMMKTETEDTLEEYRKRVKGLEAVVEAEKDAVIERVHGLGISIQEEIKTINAETRRLSEAPQEDWGDEVWGRRGFLGILEQVSERIDIVGADLMKAEGPTEFIRSLQDMGRVIVEFDEKVQRQGGADYIKRVFTPALETASEHQRAYATTKEGVAEGEALHGESIKDLLQNLDRLRELTGDATQTTKEHTAWLDEGTLFYRDQINVLEGILSIGLDNLDLEKRRRISVLVLAEAYERADKAVTRLTEKEARRAQTQGLRDRRRIIELQNTQNRALIAEDQLLTQVHHTRRELGISQEENKLQREEEITSLKAQRHAVNENLRILEEERRINTRMGLLMEQELEDLDEKIEGLKLESTHLNEVIKTTRELHHVQTEQEELEARLALSRAHLTAITEKMSDAQQNFNELIQFEQEMLTVQTRLKEVELRERELTATSRLLPVLGHIISARREGLNNMRLQVREHDNELKSLESQREMMAEQVSLLEDYMAKNRELEGQEKLQADMRLAQLQRQYEWTGKLIDENIKYGDALERQLDIERRQALTRSIVDHLQPTIDMYQSFADSMREIDNQIVLDRHKFQLEYMDQLKHGEINHAQHTHIMLAQQKFLASREEHLRQMRIASLVRDVGREISLYAARLAAQSGNIVAAIGLLAGGAGIIAASHNIASRIERQSTMAFQQAEIEFSRAQRQMQDMEQGMGGDDSRSRKFGGTIRADNLVVNISPTMIVEGEQIFIGSGSATEFSREVAEMMMEAIQQSIDDRRIDLSNIPRGN